METEIDINEAPDKTAATFEEFPVLPLAGEDCP